MKKRAKKAAKVKSVTAWSYAQWGHSLCLWAEPTEDAVLWKLHGLNANYKPVKKWVVPVRITPLGGSRRAK